MPPPAWMVSGLGKVLVFCALVATLSTGAAAKVGADMTAAAAAESMRARLFKSNLLLPRPNNGFRSGLAQGPTFGSTSPYAAGLTPGNRLQQTTITNFVHLT
jgi:hypothetical protein